MTFPGIFPVAHWKSPAAGGYLASDTQYFEITIAAGATTGTATISAVGSLAFLQYGGFTTPETTANQAYARITLTDSTTVTATRNTSDAGNAVTVRGCVVDPNSSLVESVEYGTITVSGAASNTATIGSIDTSRSTIIYLGLSTTNTISASADVNTNIVIVDETTVRANRTGTSNAITVSFCVVQFQSAVIQSIQVRQQTSTSNGTTISDTISAVDMANTLIFYNGVQGANSAFINNFYRVEITSTTNVTSTRTGTNTSSRTLKYTVVEFVSGVLTSNQIGNTALASVDSADSSITAVTVGNAIITWNGYSTTGSTANEVFASVKLLDTDTVRAEKNAAGTVTSTPSWAVAEFSTS